MEKKKTIFVYINSSSPRVLVHFKLFQHSPRSIQKILFFILIIEDGRGLFFSCLGEGLVGDYLSEHVCEIASYLRSVERINGDKISKKEKENNGFNFPSVILRSKYFWAKIL